MANRRIVSFNRQFDSTGDGQALTAIVTLDGLPYHAQYGLERGCVRAWGFTAGINSTFQYATKRASVGGSILLDKFVDDEFHEANGEGVDWFGITGTTKERLRLQLYPSVNQAPYWVKGRKEYPVPEYDNGLFAMLRAKATDPMSGETVVAMEWHFFQTNKVSFSGRQNSLRGPQGSSMFISFELEDIPDSGDND